MLALLELIILQENNMLKKILVASALLLTSQFASANLMTFNNSITGSNAAGSVGYSFFSIDADSTVRIETFTDLFDPELFLFSYNSGFDASDLIANNDDSGTVSAFGFSNSLLNLSLTAGNYVAAVGDFNLTLSEAVSGINNSSSFGIGSGAYSLEVDAANANVSRVPEPGVLALMAIGILGMGLARRKRSI